MKQALKCVHSVKRISFWKCNKVAVKEIYYLILGFHLLCVRDCVLYQHESSQYSEQPIRWVLLSASFYRWENRGWDRTITCFTYHRKWQSWDSNSGSLASESIKYWLPTFQLFKIYLVLLSKHPSLNFHSTYLLFRSLSTVWALCSILLIPGCRSKVRE
jgi:hypothetical protein